MRHTHYYRVKAQSHFELGYKLGKLFKAPSLDTYHAILKQISIQKPLLHHAQTFLQLTQDRFPHYIEELKGYAKAIDVDFASYWLVFLNEELDIYPEKCSTVITNEGKLVGHNEDFDDHFKKRITVLEKTIGNVSILELFYYTSLGGTSCSINSNGYAQTINTLNHTDQRIGIPRNVIGRWLSETKDISSDFSQMIHMVRSMGYCHNFAHMSNGISFIESSAHSALLQKSTSPHIHTNHYLTRLSTYEERGGEPGNSEDRYQLACTQAKPIMSVDEMKQLLENITSLASNKERQSETIARVVIDLPNKDWWCWLAREQSKGWVRYPIHFL